MKRRQARIASWTAGCCAGGVAVVLFLAQPGGADPSRTQRLGGTTKEPTPSEARPTEAAPVEVVESPLEPIDGSCESCSGLGISDCCYDDFVCTITAKDSGNCDRA